MKQQELEQVKQLLKEVVAVEEITEIERIIEEAREKVLPEPQLGFWKGKTACWEMFHCPKAVRDACPAFKDRSLPCWEIGGTYCKLDDYGASGQDTSICKVCRVYKKWGNGEPIEIKLVGSGINASLRSLAKEES